MRKCEKCQSVLGENDLYCEQCGHAVSHQPSVVENAEFCVSCGTALASTSDFCEQCGTAKVVKEPPLKTVSPQVEESKTEQTVSTNQVHEKEAQQVTSQQPKKRMARWKKILLFLLLFIIVLAIGTYKYLENHYDPMNVVVQMDEAITANDADAFMKHIKIDKDAVFDKDAYFAYIKEEWDDALKNNYVSLIEEDKASANPLQKELLGRYDDPVFYVKNEKILFGLFNGYTLQTIPVEVTAITNLQDTEIKVLEDKFGLKEVSEEEVVGMFHPGTYEIEASAKTEYGDIAEKVTFEIYSDATFMDVDLPVETYTIDVNHDFQDAILYVDGKSTKEKVSDIDELGPVPVNSKITVFAEWKDGDDKVHRSRVINLGQEQSAYLYLEFDERIALEEDSLDEDAEDEQFEVAEFILDFRDSYEDAVNHTDYSYIESYMKQGSKEEKDLIEFVDDMKKADYYYDFKDNTVTSVKKKDKQNFEAKTKEQFRFYDADGIIYDYDRVKTYYVEVIEDEYKIKEVKYNDTKKKKVN